MPCDESAFAEMARHKMCASKVEFHALTQHTVPTTLLDGVEVNLWSVRNSEHRMTSMPPSMSCCNDALHGGMSCSSPNMSDVADTEAHTTPQYVTMPQSAVAAMQRHLLHVST